MKKDYSVVPVSKTVTNNTDKEIKLELRDSMYETSILIEPQTSVILTLKTSDGLAVLEKRAALLNLDVTTTSTNEEEEEEEEEEIPVEPVYNLTVGTPDEMTDLLGKTVTELQSDVAIDDTNITGTLNYVEGYTGFSDIPEEQEGNYLALTFAATKDDVPVNKITCTLSSSDKGEVELDEDKTHIIRVTDKSATLTVKVYDNDEVKLTKDLVLSQLTLNTKE